MNSPIIPKFNETTTPNPNFFTSKLAVDYIKAIEPFHILLAEDNTAMRQLIAMALRTSGYQVTECKDGNELLEHLSAFVLMKENEIYDLIISDIKMPGISGMEIFKGIHDYVAFPPVILMSAFAGDELHGKAKAMGVAAFFDKPFEIDDLIEESSNILHASYHEQVNSDMFSADKGFPLFISYNGGTNPPLPIEDFTFNYASRLKMYAKLIKSCRLDITKYVSGEKNSHEIVLTIFPMEKVEKKMEYLLPIRKYEQNDNLFEGIKNVFKDMKVILHSMIEKINDKQISSYAN